MIEECQTESTCTEVGPGICPGEWGVTFNGDHCPSYTEVIFKTTELMELGCRVLVRVACFQTEILTVCDERETIRHQGEEVSLNLRLCNCIVILPSPHGLFGNPFVNPGRNGSSNGCPQRHLGESTPFQLRRRRTGFVSKRVDRKSKRQSRLMLRTVGFDPGLVAVPGADAYQYVT